MLKDHDIREPFFDYLEATFGKIRIIEEKRIGQSRADVVMVTENAVYGIEIKSDADTYVRLERQTKDYDIFFDYNIAAVGGSHGNHIEEHIPEHWGIITVDEGEDGNPDFYFLRRPTRNENVDMAKKLRILWRPELARILAANNLPAYNYKSKDFVRNKLADFVAPDILNRQISYELFERDYTTIEKEIDAFKRSLATKRTAPAGSSSVRGKKRKRRHAL